MPRKPKQSGGSGNASSFAFDETVVREEPPTADVDNINEEQLEKRFEDASNLFNWVNHPTLGQFIPQDLVQHCQSPSELSSQPTKLQKLKKLTEVCIKTGLQARLNHDVIRRGCQLLERQLKPSPWAIDGFTDLMFADEESKLLCAYMEMKYMSGFKIPLGIQFGLTLVKNATEAHSRTMGKRAEAKEGVAPLDNLASHSPIPLPEHEQKQERDVEFQRSVMNDLVKTVMSAKNDMEQALDQSLYPPVSDAGVVAESAIDHQAQSKVKRKKNKSLEKNSQKKKKKVLISETLNFSSDEEVQRAESPIHETEVLTNSSSFTVNEDIEEDLKQLSPEDIDELQKMPPEEIDKQPAYIAQIVLYLQSKAQHSQ